jgi:hypothetical protein
MPCCTRPDPKRRNLLLFGDSHAGALWYRLARQLPDDHLMEAAVSQSCIFTVGSYDLSSCGRMRPFVYEAYLPSHNVDAIIPT